MLARLSPIFRRYADRTLLLELPGQDLPGGGRADRIALEGSRFVVVGRAEAHRVGLVLNGAEHWVVPDGAGFSLDVPFAHGPAELRIDRGGAMACHPLPGFPEDRVRRARRALLPGFARALAGVLPQIWRWKMGGDLGAREVVKERLRLVLPSGAVVMREAAFATGDPAIPAAARGLTIVMPVYNAFDLLPEVLDRVGRHTDLPWRLVLIDDASPDPQVHPFLRDWAAARADRVTLLCNDTNLGFVGSVNRGLQAASAWPDNPVVLLNSDALVPPGWATRLLAPLADPSVASVTPMSNDAEIFTVPAPCRRHDLAPGEADALDRVASGFHPRRGAVEAPTGVGFCMALAPRFLRAVPAFDTAFGRGYGEETDWCQKTRAQGGRHLGTPALFIEHRGGVSFGSVEKQRLLERNAREISRRYPGYDQQVQDFLATDPLTAPRLALGLAFAASRQTMPVPVYLAHALGGGADTWLRDRIAEDLAAGGSAVELRVGQGHRWHLALHGPEGGARGLTDDVGLVRRLLAYLPGRRIVYSCGVGGHDPRGLPDLLLDLAGRGSQPLPGGPQPIQTLFHDYFPISPSYTLLGDDNRYRGVPRGDGPLADDPAHSPAQIGPLRDWQAAWGLFLAASETLTVFSNASRAIVQEAYPETAPRLHVAPHALRETPPPIALPSVAGRPVIGVLGNIGLHKGARVVQELARSLASSRRAGLMVIGEVAPETHITSPAIVHGAYKLRDLPGLVARHGITCWLIPSIWPETFSFTTHEALATGMPVFAFDLGAQGDAVRAARNGFVLGLNDGATETISAILRRAGHNG